MALIALLIAYGMSQTTRGMGLDFANFYDAGSKAALGEFSNLYDPFALIGGDKPLSNMSFFSAPITSYVYIPMARLSPLAALAVFKAAGTAATVAGLWLLYRQGLKLSGEDGNKGFFAIYMLAALAFQPFWTIFAVGGQTTPFAFLLLVVGHRQFLIGNSAAAALAFSVVVLVKPAFAPAAVLLFVLSDMRFRVTALAAAACVAAFSILLFGWDLHREFLAKAADESSRLLVPWKNSSPFSWIAALFTAPETYREGAVMPPPLSRMLLGLRLIAAIAVLWTLRWHLKRPIALAARRHAIYVAGLLLIVVLSPVVWAHYLTILFIPLAFLVAGRASLSPAACSVFGAAVILSVCQNLTVIRRAEKLFGFDSASEIVLIGLVKSAPALLIVIGFVLCRASVARMLDRPGWADLR